MTTPERLAALEDVAVCAERLYNTIWKGEQTTERSLVGDVDRLRVALEKLKAVPS